MTILGKWWTKSSLLWLKKKRNIVFSLTYMYIKTIYNKKITITVDNISKQILLYIPATQSQCLSVNINKK